MGGPDTCVRAWPAHLCGPGGPASAPVRRKSARGAPVILRSAAAPRDGSSRTAARVSVEHLVPRRRERADLVVGARATGAPRGCGVEASGPNARSGRFDGGDGLFEVMRRRSVAADDVRVDEAQLEALGQG